ncbi:DUF6602 domain-containing protein [Aliivibrio fischeri]|uniref:DUF6602 domain-containing protein n=1 Tax=Aliivibrio fischeri TaxID=668 RepID=UPI0012DA648A|nr:DUF6602 domain-containing protein [Aliivibrio fischeri]MUJ26333.1 hypothetical protein [Aliivibrio fischeri]
MEYRLLSEHFGKVKKKLLQYSEHFDIANHGDIKGYGREALVNEFLKDHLPDSIEYLTGEIFDQFDARSGQVDIILQSKLYPKVPLLGNTQLVFSDAVMAVIEVKSTLTKQHLYATFEQFRKIKALNRQEVIKGSGLLSDLDKTPCIIFAFNGPSHKKLMEHINKYAALKKLDLKDFAPDIIIILDSDFYICRNDGWIFPPVASPALFRHWEGLPHENLVGIYTYLINLCSSYLYSPPSFRMAPYFDKSILKKS